jgi:hypothetical protein
MGMKRAVIAALLSKVVGDPNICKVVNAEVYYSLAFPKAQITTNHGLDIRALAVLCLLYIFTFELAPDPISPALLQFSIGGMADIIDIAFVRSFAPETANKLAVWPLDHDSPLVIGPNLTGQNQLANLICEHLEMQVRYYHVNTCTSTNSFVSQFSLLMRRTLNEKTTQKVSIHTSYLDVTSVVLISTTLLRSMMVFAPTLSHHCLPSLMLVLLFYLLCLFQ